MLNAPAMDPTDPVDALAHLLDGPDPTGRARRMLERLGGLHRLRTLPAGALAGHGHLAPAEAHRLRAALDLAALALSATPPDGLRRPEAVASTLASVALAPVEELWVLPVDCGLRPLGRHLVARGGRASCAVDGADVLRPALLDGAVGLFLVHNHPSGDVTPSDTDRRFTRRLEEQAGLLGLALHDHLVVAGDRWASVVSGRRGRLEPPAAEATDERAAGSTPGALPRRSSVPGSAAASASRTP
ncbi:MAG: JAB domain-containing protein [Myxococcota bacterium]